MDLGTPRAETGADKGGEKDNEEEDTIADDYDPKECLWKLIRSDLEEKGVPREQVAFIHDYKNKNAQVGLFEKVRRGEIRVLVGSTQKLGVGVNIQDRAAAVHHIDVPWRPRDLEQREGRIS